MLLKYTLIFLLGFCLISCGGDDDSDNSTTEIADYLIAEGISEMPDANGMVVVIDNPGDENKPSQNSTVLVDYIGYYLDGVEFDNSYTRGEPFFTNLSAVIRGWTLGLPQFGIGGSGKLIIPASLGYGSNPPSGVRKNAVLVFEIELLDVDGILEKELVAAADKLAIENYIAENNLDATLTSEGVYVIIEEEGSSEKPDIENEVTVDYKGYFLNGDQFDSSYDRGQPSTFELKNVIEGWRVGIPNFGRDGKGTLIVPSALGYGPFGSIGVPPNTPLVFDIELYDFK